MNVLVRRLLSDVKVSICRWDKGCRSLYLKYEEGLN